MWQFCNQRAHETRDLSKRLTLLGLLQPLFNGSLILSTLITLKQGDWKMVTSRGCLPAASSHFAARLLSNSTALFEVSQPPPSHLLDLAFHLLRP